MVRGWGRIWRRRGLGRLVMQRLEARRRLADMALFAEDQKERISQAISDAESKTSGEVIAVLTEMSNTYYYVPFMWAALAALIVPWPLIHFTWMSVQWIYLIQLLVFLILLAVLWPKRTRAALVPKSIRQTHVRRRATEQFLAQNLHTTAGRTGVLIFVSIAERHAVILADHAIDAKVEAGAWQAIVEHLTRDIGDGRPTDGFVHAIEEIGKAPRPAFPARRAGPERTAEPPDHTGRLTGEYGEAAATLARVGDNMATAFQAAAASDSVPRAPLKARISWMLFDWATQPYYTLVQTFLFAPYFANAVVENAACGNMIAAGSEKAACGQALWGYAAAVAGLLIALLSPLLGAAADGRGARKPWIAALSLVFLAGLTTLWSATPGANFSVIGLVLLGFIAATLAAELMAVMSNAIMVGLVPQHELGRLSGNGWAVGYFGGLASLIVIVGLWRRCPAKRRRCSDLTQS